MGGWANPVPENPRSPPAGHVGATSTKPENPEVGVGNRFLQVMDHPERASTSRRRYLQATLPNDQPGPIPGGNFPPEI